MNNPQPSSVTIRSGLDPELAKEIWAKTPVSELPFATEIEHEGKKYAVAMVVEQYYTVFELPFTGYSNDWDVILPITNSNDLLKQML